MYIYRKHLILAAMLLFAFPKKLKDVLFLNSGIQGCALMFNAALRDICKNAPDIVAMHDHVLTVCAAALGELSYLNKG